MIYEAWGTVESGADTFSTQEGIQDLQKKGLIEEGSVHLFSVVVDDWFEAMTVYHEANGWEPYRYPEDEDEK